MPTIAEPIWPECDARIKQAVVDFVTAKPREIDDSEDVLTARLFGLGLRGQDLRAEVYAAVVAKQERQKCPGTGKVCPRVRLKGTCECLWKERA